MVAPLAIAALGLTGLTGLLFVTRRPLTARVGPLPAAPAGTLAKVGDEVAFPVSAIPGLQAPPNAGGVIMVVDSATPAALRGPIVAFVGTGGTADLAVPIGPLELPRSAVSAITAAPADRVGRFAQPGDDVFLPPSRLPEGAKAAFIAGPDAALFLAPDVLVQVRLKQLDASGAVAGDVTGIAVRTGGMGTVRALATPIPASFFPRVEIVRVVRNGSLIFEARTQPPFPGAPRVGLLIDEDILLRQAQAMGTPAAAAAASSPMARRVLEEAARRRHAAVQAKAAQGPTQAEIDAALAIISQAGYSGAVPQAARFTIEVENAPVLETRDAGAQTLFTLPKGTSVYVLGSDASDSWCLIAQVPFLSNPPAARIGVADPSGWVPCAWLKQVQHVAVVDAPNGLRVRAAPSVASPVITLLPNGTPVTVLDLYVNAPPPPPDPDGSEQFGWARVQLPDQRVGFVASRFLAGTAPRLQ